jgi:integrase
MIGLHRNGEETVMRRDEHPLRRVNPSGEVRWVARYTRADGTRASAGTYGKRGPCKTQSEGCCAAHAIWAAYAADTPGRRPDPDLLGAYFDRWLRENPRRERTAAGYDARIRAVLDVPIEGVPLREWRLPDLRRRHVKKELVDVLLVEHGRAASGASAVISALSAMFEDAVDDELMELNPAHGVRISGNDPRVRKAKRERILATWDEMHALARAAGPYEPLIRVLSDCGLRLGEMLALDVRDVQGDTLAIHRSAWRGVVSEGTKQSPRREVPVPPTLAGMLAERKRDRIGLLFASPSGGAWTDRSFYRVVWYPARDAVGSELLPHDLRHSWVSRLSAAGVDRADLARWAGHTPDTATRIYTHSTGDTFPLVAQVIG